MQEVTLATAGSFHTPNNFERAVFVINPGAAEIASSDGEVKLDQQIASSIASVVATNVVQKTRTFMTTGNQLADEEELAGIFREGDLALPIGGDGNSHLLMNAVYVSGIDIPIYPLGGGGVNDLAKNLNGPPGLMAVKDVLRYGNVVPFHPLKYEINDGETVETRRALLYSGIGTNADLSNKYNQKAFRSRLGHGYKAPRRAYQIAAAMGKLASPSEFDIEDREGKRKLTDLIVSNNETMATVLNFPVNFERPEAWRTEASGEKRAAAALWLAQALTNRTPGSYIRKDEKPYDLEIQSEAELHLDGETQRLKPGTVVTISVDDKPWHGLSNRFELAEAS